MTRHKGIIAGVVLVVLAIIIGLGIFVVVNNDDDDSPEEVTTIINNPDTTQDTTDTANDTITITSDYLGSYQINDATYGTDVSVTVSGNERVIVSNALPNHETGEFPNPGNPNTITAQDNTYTYPLSGVLIGNATTAREPGVAINGIKFEPETAEQVTCTSGESYRIEALQSVYDLGFDFNDSHVQPDGTYHYHGVPTSLINLVAGTDDLVHIGFAADGFLMYYSQSGAYVPSYQISAVSRTGTNCTYRNETVRISNTQPDGVYVQDWEYVEGLGDLDECNGTTINGEYAYVVTDLYPFVGRCLNGEYTSTDGPGGGNGMPPQGQGSSGQGTPPQGGQGPR